MSDTKPDDYASLVQHMRDLWRLEDHPHISVTLAEAAYAIERQSAEIARLQREVADTQEDRQSCREGWNAEIKRAEAAESQVRQLQEALREIISVDPVDAALDPAYSSRIARAAMSKEPQK